MVFSSHFSPVFLLQILYFSGCISFYLLHFFIRNDLQFSVPYDMVLVCEVFRGYFCARFYWFARYEAASRGQTVDRIYAAA